MESALDGERFQTILKARYGGDTLTTPSGTTTDLTTDRMHIEIKLASNWLLGYRHLLDFYSQIRRPELRLYLYDRDSLTATNIKKMMKNVVMGTTPVSIFYLDPRGNETIVFNAHACWGDLCMEPAPNKQDVLAQRMISNLTVPIESFAAAVQNGLIFPFTRGGLYEHVPLHQLQEAARNYWKEQEMRLLDMEHWLECVGIYLERLIDVQYFNFTSKGDYRIDLREMRTFKVSDILSKKLKGASMQRGTMMAQSTDHLL